MIYFVQSLTKVKQGNDNSLKMPVLVQSFQKKELRNNANELFTCE